MTTEATSPALHVGVLGPLVLYVDGTATEVPGVRRRALLAVLALESGRTVSIDRLIDSLWPDAETEPPDNAQQALYNHVSRLRAHLGRHGDRLRRDGAGYRLELGSDELDVSLARGLAAALAQAEPAERGRLARQALDLWRGPALAEFRSVADLAAEAVGLDELRLRLVDDLLAARVELGDRTVVGDAVGAAAAVPLRERTAILLVRALAMDGRTADAMTAAQTFRRHLAEETGLDPSPALADLEQRVASGGLAAAEPVEDSWSAPRAVARPDSPLVGRDHDREEVLRLLQANATVTLTGPGGVGKTRLALDVAADPAAYPPRADGGERVDAVVVDLAAVDRPERVGQAVATTLGLRVRGDFAPDDIADALAGRELLLVLDNCEHVAEACRDLVVAVRRQAAAVRVLATSRVTLHVPGEYVVRLQPLPVPRDGSDPDALRRQPAFRAFLEHARRRRADFDLDDADAADLVEVLRRLDGLPLGIELAARQVSVMPLSAVRERLDRALDLVTGAPGRADDRQRSLRATIASSYHLLGDSERRLLRALAPFPGGVDLATVEQIAAIAAPDRDPVDLLHPLVDSSLLVTDAAAGRYRLLFTVRAFLLDQLVAEDERDAAEDRFLDLTLHQAREIAAGLMSADEPAADRRLRAELDNLRAARDVAQARDRQDVRVGLTLELEDAATWRDLRELWAWAYELAEDDRLADHPDRPRVLGAAAEAARLRGDLDLADRWSQEALALAGPDADPLSVCRAYSAAASVAHFRGDFARASELWVRSEEGRRWDTGAWLASAALAAGYGGDHARAAELLSQAQARGHGAASHRAFAAYVDGELRAATDPGGAIACYLEAIELGRHSGATFVEGVAGVALASARVRTGDLVGAADGLAGLIVMWRRTGQSTQLWTTVRNAAALLAAAGRRRAAALLLVAADAEPAAAVVDQRIARSSSRIFTPLEGLVDAVELAALRVEAGRLGPSGVLDLAVAELQAVAG